MIQPPKEIYGMPVIQKEGKYYAIPIVNDRCTCPQCKSLVPHSAKPMKLTLISAHDRFIGQLGKR